MSEKNKTLVLLGLDLFGTLLFAVGAFGQFGPEGSYLPPAWQFPGHNWVLISLGIGLILPYMMHVIRKGRQTAEPR